MMETESLIPASDFCIYHNIEISFVNALGDYGLITISRVNNIIYLKKEEIGRLEKFLRLHLDLDVNLEAIETINHLLNRVENMQNQIQKLQNRLRFYEEE